MGVYLSPGVYTIETDASNYPSAVSTAICGMVGTAVKGTVNDPVYITSPQQYIDTFGEPTPSSYLGYAALAFLEKGNQLYITRVGAQTGPDAIAKAVKDLVTGTQSTETAATLGLYTLTTESFDIIANGGTKQTIYYTVTGGSATTLAAIINTQTVGFSASDVGGALKLTSNALGAVSTLEILRLDNVPYSFANIAAASITGTVAEVYSITAANKYLKIKINGGVEVTVTLTEGVGRTATSVASDIDTALDAYGAGATSPSDVVIIATDESGSGTSIEIEAITSSAYSTLGFVVGTTSGTSTIAAGTNSATNVIKVEALNEGTWGNTIYTAIANRADGTFDLSVYYNSLQVERFGTLKRGTANVDDDFYIERQINTISNYITVSDYASETGNPHDIIANTAAGLLANGKDGIVGVSDADYIGVAWNPTADASTGLQTFSNAEEINVNIICVPGISSTAVIAAMLTLCEGRADCMAIIDPPYGLRPQEVTDWHNGSGSGNTTAFNSSYGALYWDWLLIYDAYNAQEVYVPPSGYLAGVYALNDFVSEPWYAPAGLNRGRILSAIGLRYSPNLGERNLLYGDGNAINPIVNFVQDGITVWGQRTLQREATALDRVNVRRLMLYLRKVAANFSRYFVFEPDDPATWRRVRFTFESLLADVQSRRGVRDYKVICDETINTQARVDRNELWVRILVRPTKAAEFIVVEFVIMPQGATLETETVI